MGPGDEAESEGGVAGDIPIGAAAIGAGAISYAVAKLSVVAP